ncbi:outer membrane beta-barrel protein [Phaeocystidibacter marisrubri]|nr:outer membrane beta-barrel protein [Phaeocystidibacter marisrubri]GGH67998.1 hypothetical protein GCM10011318_07580 [Phaeocystidibacter marisrubri]
MKKILLMMAMVVAGMGLHAQEVEWGVKGGLTYNMTDLGLKSAVNTSGEVFSGERSNNGWHLGLAVRDEFTKNFYVQLDGLYNQSKFTLSGTDANGNPIQTELMQQSIQTNLTPGIKMFHFLRVQVGLNGNIWLDDAYADTFGRFELGYQLGVGVDLGPLTFDIGYNASFKDNRGDWNGIPLSQNRGELLMSVGILL